MNVETAVPGGYWCLEEIDFLDAAGNEIDTSSAFGTCFASTEHGTNWACGFAFNQAYSVQGGTSYYCSKGGHQTGTLGFSFNTPTAIASWVLRSLNLPGTTGHTPRAFKLEGSSDGSTWTTIHSATTTTITSGQGVQETINLQ